MLAERGLPIMRSTLCKTGTHMFITIGCSSTQLPEPDQRCDCGLVTFAEVSDAHSQDTERP